MSKLITIHNGDAELVVAPEAGGSIARYSGAVAGQRRDFLRRASDEDIASGDPRRMGSFPLVPFSNRIRDGKFTFLGRAIELPRNNGPHAIHGVGFERPWAIEGRRDSELTIECRHTPNGQGWPFPFLARQRFHVLPDRLEVTMTVDNLGAEAMPLGMGWHPYFPRTKQAVVTAAVEKIWATDHEVMPTGLIAPPPQHDPSRGLRVDEFAIDNGFAGWNGTARIDWPEWGARLTMTALPPLGFLVVFTPAGRDFFCVEPVSHCTDAFNLEVQGRRDTGMLVLAPKEHAAATMTLMPQAL